MPVSRVQTLRSSVKGARPSTGTQEVGFLYTNFPDRQIGVIDTGKAAMDLLAVRFFSVAADYGADNFVYQGGSLWRSKGPVASGPFNEIEWDVVVTDSAITGAMLLTRLLDVDGAGSGLDADYYRGLEPDYFLERANHIGTLPPTALVPIDILNAVKTVDGGGSGLDADFFRGLAPSYYLERANHTGVQTISTITGLQPQLDAKAPIASPAFTGNPVAPTPATADNSPALATTAYVKSNLINYAPLNAPAFSGNPTAPTPITADSSSSIATTAFVKNQAYAPLASPAFSGNPTAPTPATSDNDTTLATTAFVQAHMAAVIGGIPPGTVIWTAANAAPPGYLKANGAQVSRTTYNNLFIAIGTTYGAGDGTTTFNLPDLRGEFVRSFDDGRGVDPSRIMGSTQAANLEQHTHDFVGNPMPNHDHTASSGTESADHSHYVSGTSSTGSANHNHGLTMFAQSILSATGGLAVTGYRADAGNQTKQTDSDGAAHTHTVNFYSGGRSAAHTHAITVNGKSAGTPTGSNTNYGAGTDTRPRNIALLACIKY